MHTYRLAMPGNFSIKVTHPLAIFADDDNIALSLAANFLPGVRIESIQDAEISPVASITFHQSSRKMLRRTGKNVALYGLWEGQHALLDLLHLSYSICRLEWLKRGLYPVHSACFGRPGLKHSLVIGHSGSGKTSLALHASQYFGRKIFSANKTLIDLRDNAGMTAIAGTPTITTPNFQSKYGDWDATSSVKSFQDRVALPRKNGRYSTEPSVEIGTVYLVSLNDAYKCMELVSAPSRFSQSALHQLFPFFLDTVNANTVLCDGSAVFAGDAPAGTLKELSTALAASLREMTVYRLSGSIESMASMMSTYD